MSEQLTTIQTPDASTYYTADYYLDADGQPQNTFAFNDLTLSRALAIARACNVPPDGRILDYGCGLGAMTLAFSKLGYDAVGVDPSPHALEHSLPEARKLIQPLTRETLLEFEKRPFDLIVAKDVFEHIDERQLHDTTDRLLCLGKQIMAIIPLADMDGKFLFPLYENDPTHITRLTRDWWQGFFAYSVVEDCTELTPLVRRPDKVESTICLRLAEPDPEKRYRFEWARPSNEPRPLRERVKQFLSGVR